MTVVFIITNHEDWVLQSNVTLQSISCFTVPFVIDADTGQKITASETIIFSKKSMSVSIRGFSFISHTYLV